MSKLSQSVEDFFLQAHITKLCPDKKRTTTDLTTGKPIQLRFRMGTLKSLHQQCLYPLVKVTVPSPHFAVMSLRKPKDNEWGTCFCI